MPRKANATTMDSTNFEGFTGISINNTTFSNDIMLLMVLLLLLAFAVIIRLKSPLPGSKASSINGIFKVTAKENFLFNAFMTFQALFLCSILIFSVVVEYKSLTKPDYGNTFAAISILLIIFFVFFMFKKAIYAIFGHIFIDNDAKKAMFNNHQTLFSIWGISLYIPVLWILLIGKYFFTAIILMIISYLIFRIMLIYRFFYIFFNKNTGLLFFSSYLCAQEIVPLIFLYEGLIYMYNIIEKNNIWQ